MTQYRYQLERYRGRSTRHVCPQCGRKNVFTRYIDTENNNIYISDNVGKCNRLDKYGYHYTPHQYFTDNPWKRDTLPREDGSLRPCGYHYTPHQYFTDNPWKRENVCSFFLFHRKNERTNKNKTTPPRRGYIPQVGVAEQSHGGYEKRLNEKRALEKKSTIDALFSFYLLSLSLWRLPF